MVELDIPEKLTRLCMMTMNNTTSSVKIGSDISEPSTSIVLGQPIVYLVSSSTLLMEAVIRRARVETSGRIFYKSIQLLAYVN